MNETLKKELEEKMIQSSLNKKSNLLNEIKKEIDKKGENNLKKLL